MAWFKRSMKLIVVMLLVTVISTYAVAAISSPQWVFNVWLYFMYLQNPVQYQWASGNSEAQYSCVDLNTRTISNQCVQPIPPPVY